MKDWGWLKDSNFTTAAKGWSIVALWILTGVVVNLALLFATSPEKGEGLLTIWLGGLTAFSAVGAYSQANHRGTDYEALRIKAGANQPAPPQNITVQAQQANVSGTEGAK